MYQRIARKMVVDHRRCASNTPQPDLAEQELGGIGEVGSDEFEGLDVLGEVELAISAGLIVCLGPGVAAGAGPKALDV